MASLEVVFVASLNAVEIPTSCGGREMYWSFADMIPNKTNIKGPERLGDANKTIITPEWIAEQRELMKRPNVHVPNMLEGFRVALDEVEQAGNERDLAVRVAEFQATRIKELEVKIKDLEAELSKAREEIERLKNLPPNFRYIIGLKHTSCLMCGEEHIETGLPCKNMQVT